MIESRREWYDLTVSSDPIGWFHCWWGRARAGLRASERVFASASQMLRALSSQSLKLAVAGCRGLKGQ